MATRKQSLTVPVVDKTKEDCHCGCAPCDGTCCSLDCIVQPHFFCGQLLTDADLSALVKWSRDRFSLSRLRHGWGVVCGLDVRGKRGAPTTIVVTPGYAVDCCGNDIIVCTDAVLDIKNKCGGEESACADLRHELQEATQLSARDRLRAVDIYIQYDEESAEPITAMGRGSCKQVTECEYSRTRETYKLTCEVAVADNDPMRVRARKWHEGYEQCLDVLKNFNSQFGPNSSPGDMQRWLQRWIDEHPDYDLGFVRELIQNPDFLKSPANLIQVLFILVQVCRNAYLNCACFGCDENARLPLARAWVLPEDRRLQTQCRIVTVDSYPPYRRLLQPECWPAPLGSVNVGRFIWHRWDEVCTAVTDLGLKVERTPFALPTKVEDLERALTCDLFVPCGERRVALVMEADILGERVVGFCRPVAPGEVKSIEQPQTCPEISVRHIPPQTANELPSFTAELTGGSANIKPTFKWTVSGGSITSRSDTRTILVKPDNAQESYTVTVIVGGLPPQCEDTTATATVDPQVDIGGQDTPQVIADPFKDINGIGESRSNTLQQNNIKTVADLAATTPEQLGKIFAGAPGPVLKDDDFLSWIQQAQKLSDH